MSAPAGERATAHHERLPEGARAEERAERAAVGDADALLKFDRLFDCADARRVHGRRGQEDGSSAARRGCAWIVRSESLRLLLPWLVGKIVVADLRLAAKIRNRFAHDLREEFSDPQISAWCTALAWHRLWLAAVPPAAATDRDLFQVGVNQPVAHMQGLVALASLDKRREFQPGCG